MLVIGLIHMLNGSRLTVIFLTTVFVLPSITEIRCELVATMYARLVFGFKAMPKGELPTGT